MAVQARAKVHNTIGAPPPARPHEQTRRRADHLRLHLHERIDARTAIIGHWISHRAWGEAARAAWRYREYGAISIAIWVALTPWLIYTGFPTGDTIRCALFAAIVGWPFAWLTGDGQQARAVHREQRRLADKLKPTPHVTHVTELGHATIISGQIPDGIEPDALQRQRQMLATCYRTGTDITVHDSGSFSIRLTHQDLLAKAPVYTPSDAPGSTLRLGVDRDRREITWGLLGSGLLIAGMKGAGKSITANAQVAQLAPLDLELRLVDPHRIDFKPWYDHAVEVARDVGSALTLLERSVDLHLAELERLDADDVDLVTEPRRVLVIDELAWLTHQDSRHAKEARLHLQTLLAGGRKTGDIVIAATQYPEVKVIPSIIRGQFTHRLGMRCEFPAATNVLFGDGAQGAGINLAKLPANQPGRGILLTAGRYTELRAYGLQGERKRTVAKAIPPRTKPVSDQVDLPAPQPQQIATAIPLPPAPPTEKQTETDPSTIITPAALREHCIEALDHAGPFGVSNPALAEKLDVPPMRVYRQMAALRRLGLARTDGTRWYREAS